MVIYRTQEWDGHGKHNVYYNEYDLVGGRVEKYKCHRYKVFDGRENEWLTSRQLTGLWRLGVDMLPEWLARLVKNLS